MKKIIILISFFICSCSFISFDGKARSWEKGKKKFTKLCKNHKGLKYHLGQVKGVCNDETIFQ